MTGDVMLDSPFRLRLPPVFSVIGACRHSDCEIAGLTGSSFSSWSRGDLEEGIRLAETAARTEFECAGNCRGPAKLWYAALLVRIRDLPSAARVVADVDELTARPGTGRGLVAASLLCAADLAFAG